MKNCIFGLVFLALFSYKDVAFSQENILSDEVFLYCLDSGERKENLLIYLGTNNIAKRNIGNAWVFSIVEPENIERLLLSNRHAYGLKVDIDRSNYEEDTISPKGKVYEYYTNYVYRSSVTKIELLGYTTEDKKVAFGRRQDSNLRITTIDRRTGDVTGYATPFQLNCQSVPELEFRRRYEDYKNKVITLYNEELKQRLF